MKRIAAVVAIFALSLAGCVNANAPIDPATGKAEASATHTPGLGNWDQLNGPEKVLRVIDIVPLIAVAVPVLVVGAVLNDVATNPEMGQAIADTISNTTIYSDTVKTPHGTYDITGSCVYSNCSSSISKRK